MDTKKQNPPASQLNHQLHKASMQAHRNTKGTAINTQKSSAKNRTTQKAIPKGTTAPDFHVSDNPRIIMLAEIVVLLIVSFLCPFRFFAELFSVLIAVPLVLL